MTRRFRRTALSAAAAQAALLWSASTVAQTVPAPQPAASAAAPAASAAAPARAAGVQQMAPVMVSGRRAALESAQKIKQDSDEIVDSIVAEDIGKLPDRSVTEVLQ